jgi:hypothetical protein
MLKASLLISVLLSALSLTVAAETVGTKPKYGPAATRLSQSHQYISQHPAPDFWALMPYYTAQQNGASCSIASVTMLVNGARSNQNLMADTELATQNSVLKKTADESWSKATSEKVGGGVSLDELGVLTVKALKSYGFTDAYAEVVHTNNTSQATLAKLRLDLTQNEKSAKDFILINFIQGVYTGDAEVGHIAPIAAYDTVSRRVLVLDPDREWYEPYWVSEETLLRGMATTDKTSVKSRGYVRVHAYK